MVIFDYIGALFLVIFSAIPFIISIVIMGYLFAFIIEFLLYMFW